jgi:hypothetical protein
LEEVQGRAAYENLLVWQKRMHFANAVIDLTEQLVQNENITAWLNSLKPPQLRCR